MRVVRLRLQSNLNGNLSVGRDFHQSWFLAEFCDQRMSVVETFDGANFIVLGGFDIVKDGFVFPSKFSNLIAPCDQNVSAWQHKSISRGRPTGVPDFLVVFTNDAGECRAGNEERMPDRFVAPYRRNIHGANAASQQEHCATK